MACVLNHAQEFGKLRHAGVPRSDYFAEAFKLTERSFKSGRPLKGSLFWTLTADGAETPTDAGAISLEGGAYGVLPTEPLFTKEVTRHAKSMQKIARRSWRREGCPVGLPPGPPPAQPVIDCPPGFEGPPACATDVNECARALDDCGPNAYCENTPGSFTCRCLAGYDGPACQPTELVTQASTRYLPVDESQAWAGKHFSAMQRAACVPSLIVPFPPVR